MTDETSGSPPLSEDLSTAQAQDVRVIAKGGAVQIAGQVTQRGVAFFYRIVAFNLLGKALFGLYLQVAQVLTIAGQVGLAGYNYAAMRFIARARAASDHGAVRGSNRFALISTGIASTAALVVLVGAAPWIADAFADSAADSPELAHLLRIGAPFIPLFALAQVIRYSTQAYKTMVPSVVAGNIVQPIVRFVLGTAALMAGLEVAGAISTLTVSMAVSGLVGWWYYRHLLTEDERVAAPRADRGEMTRFSLAQAGASLFGVQSLGLGIIILGIASTDVQVAYFGIALGLQGPGNVFLGGIVNIWAPVVSDLHEKGEILRLDSLYKTINRWIATFSFPVFAVLIIEPDLFARLFGGSEGLGATSVIAILAIGNIFYTGTGPTGYVISMTGHPGINFINSIVAVVLYVVLGIWIVPEHGAVGMAIVDSAVTAIINSVRVVQAKKLVGIQPFGRSYFKPVVATLVGAAALLPWSLLVDDNVPLEIAGVAVASIVYLGVLRALGVDPEEQYVWQMIRRKAFQRGGRSK